MSAQQDDMFSGIWYCWHWYPSKDDTGEDITRNRMKAYRQGKDLVLQSEPNGEESYMFVRLSLYDGLATGTWYESTSPDGDFGGATYSGAGQLLVNEDGRGMEGKWAGAGYDHNEGHKRIYTGRWALSRKEDAYDKA